MDDCYSVVELRFVSIKDPELVHDGKTQKSNIDEPTELGKFKEWARKMIHKYTYGVDGDDIKDIRVEIDTDTFTDRTKERAESVKVYKIIFDYFDSSDIYHQILEYFLVDLFDVVCIDPESHVNVNVMRYQFGIIADEELYL